MRRIAFVLAAAILLPSLGWAQQRGLNLQATPRNSPKNSQPNSPLPLLPASRPRGVPTQAGPSYDLAPTPNRDIDEPQGPRASNSPELAPSLFTRGQQYRGEGYSAGSSAQAGQEQRVRPGAGFKLRMPLQQE